jgi:micrococcal nuclease
MILSGVKFVRGIDGDTIVVNLVGLPAIFGFLLSVRLAGIQCEEIRSKDPGKKHRALIAKGFTQRWCEAAPTLELHNVKRGKYFRIVADVYNGKDYLNFILLRKELAVKCKS